MPRERESVKCNVTLSESPCSAVHGGSARVSRAKLQAQYLCAVPSLYFKLKENENIYIGREAKRVHSA